MITIRNETKEDVQAIYELNKTAFGSPNEAELVDNLRNAGAVILSLVAVKDAQVIGHILFSPVHIESSDSSFLGVGLAPMAVLPQYQRKGIGSKLIRRGIKGLKEAGYSALVVLGHADYYPRFGFVPASRYGISCEYDVADEVFMVLLLNKMELNGKRWIVRYRPEFNAV